MDYVVCEDRSMADREYALDLMPFTLDFTTYKSRNT